MNYCKYLKKRKNKPFCCLHQNAITFSQCRECASKEYKKSDIKISNNKKCPKFSKNSAFSNKKTYKMSVKSKKLAKLEKNRQSVFTDDLENCYLCGRKKDDLHEIFSGRNRINSIKYNFILPICRECHSLNQNNPFFNDYWHRQAQLYWEDFIGTRENFIKVFKRNYLD